MTKVDWLYTAIILAVIVGITVACTGQESTATRASKSYTPQPADLYIAYSTALDDLSTALDHLERARTIDIKEMDAAPTAALDAVQEARDCNTPIDALTNDPRASLGAAVFGGSDSSPPFRAADEAPRRAAHNIAAAHIASPADRDAIEVASSAHMRTELSGQPTPDDPLYAAWFGRLEDDHAFQTYLETLEDTWEAYRPFMDLFDDRSRDLINGLILAPDYPGQCTDDLFLLYESYMDAFEEHSTAMAAFFNGRRATIEEYVKAIRTARERYAPK